LRQTATERLPDAFRLGEPGQRKFAHVRRARRRARCGLLLVIGGRSPYDEAPERMAKGLARHPIPILLMARFAVDQRDQGRGLGRGLFKDALKRCLGIAQEAGIRALMTHAKDAEAKRFYESFGMEECPTNPLHLYLPMKDVLRELVGAGESPSS